MPPNYTQHEHAVKTIIRSLLGRGGFDHWWEDITPDIQREIEQELEEKLEKIYA